MALAVLLSRLVVLAEQLEDIEVLLFEMDLFLVEAVRHNLGLLSDWLRATVDLLKDDLHHGGLELGKHAHLRKGLLSLPLLLLLREFAGGAAIEEGRYLNALRNALRVLALLLLDALLDVLGVIALENVGLALETFIKLSQVLNEILHGL